jgi:hypothetical protein
MSTFFFVDACDTYRYLLEKGYPERAALKLVADHHRLDRTQRNCLFRGVVRAAAAAERRRKLVSEAQASGSALALDWYNLLITVESHLRGVTLFVAEDGVIRDAAAAHGSYRATAVTDRALEEIVNALFVIGPSRVDAFLDSPVAHSGSMAGRLRARLERAGIPAAVSLERSADHPLKGYAGTVATSDSIVMDHASAVLDCARCVLRRAFGVTPPALADLFPGDRAARG